MRVIPWAGWSLLFVSLTLLGGCGDDPPAVAPASLQVVGSGAASGGDAPLLFAVPPYDTPSRLVTRYQPLMEYLGERLRRPVQLYVATGYDDQIRRIAEGSVDFAYMGPTPYLRAHDRYGAGAAERVRLVAAEPPYAAVIIARKEGPVRTPADLRGRTMAFGSHHSFASHYMPRAMLLRHGISLADIMDYAYLGRHERVVLAVLHGDYDAGGTTLGIARKYLDREPGLRIVEVSPPLPPLAVVARPGLPQGLFDAARKALIQPGPQGLDAIRLLGEEVMFRTAADDEFELARRVVERLEGDCPDRPLPW